MLDINYQPSGSVVKHQVNEILELNRKAAHYGLQLSRQQALELIEAKNQSLASHGRIELGNEAIINIMNAFCSSPYINSEDYASTLNELVETFYYVKNETEDRISDDKIIEIMKDLFNKSSRGSLELLRNRDITVFTRLFRYFLQANDRY